MGSLGVCRFITRVACNEDSGLAAEEKKNFRCGEVDLGELELKDIYVGR